MDPPQQAMDEARSNEPVETLDYLCSQIPAEIRNTIYNLILDDTLPNYVFRHGIATSRPWLGADPSIVNYLSLCSINKQIREEFGSLLMSKVPLVISVNEITVAFPIFIRRDCLTGVCGHSNHAVVPRKVTIQVSGTSFINRRPRNLYKILKAKAWDHDLKIKFIPRHVASDHGHKSRQSADGTCALLNKFLGNPPAVFLDAVKSGFIRSAKFKQGKGAVFCSDREGSIYCEQNGCQAMNPIAKWRFCLRNSSGELTEEDKDLLCSYCSHVLQILVPKSAVEIDFLVYKDYKSSGERWVYCSSSKALLRPPTWEVQ